MLILGLEKTSIHSKKTGGIDLNPTIARTTVKRVDAGVNFASVSPELLARFNQAQGVKINILDVKQVLNVLPLIGLGH